MSFEDFDIRAYLTDIGIQFWESGSKNVGTGWIGIRCIFCHDDHNHLGINLYYKSFSCWKCSESGSLIKLLQEMEGINYGQALSLIEDYETPIPLEPEKKDRLQGDHVDILPYGCLGRLTGGQRAYLERRRFDPDTLVEQWGIQGGPPDGPWCHRIIIPVKLGDRLVTWIGMDTTGEKNAKYKAAKISESYVPTNELVYASDHAGRNVLVVEGVTDVWRIGPGAVGLLGMGTTVEKIQPLLALDAEHYFIMLDGEPQAIKNAKNIATQLSSAGKSVEVLELPSGDPDDLPEDEVIELRRDLDIG